MLKAYLLLSKINETFAGPIMTKNIKVFKSTCGMCHGGCGVLVSIKDGKIIEIKGDPKSPLNKGALCPKGRASLEHVYNKKRLKRPLQRVGKRGSGKWKEISWDSAIELVAKSLENTKKNYGINDGDWMFIETKIGKIKQKAKVTDGLVPQVIHIEHGWWYPESSKPFYDFWVSNANILTDDRGPFNPEIGSYQLRAILCKISKA